MDRKKFRENDYDVVVIGGGLSGLSAATFLSKKGLSVALFEKNNQLGGFVNSFKRGEYVFEASTHQISLDDISLESIKRLLDLKDVEFERSDALYESVLFEPETYDIIRRYQLPWGIDAYKARLKEFFPKNSDQIDKLLLILTNTGKDTARIKNVSREPMRYLFDMLCAQMLKNGKGLSKQLGMKRFPAIGKYSNQTFSEMTSFIEDPLLRWLISSYSMYTGSCTEEVNGLMMSAMVYRYIENGPHFVKYGTGKLISELANVITKNNGHVFKGKSVDSIKVEGGIVKGIRTADGKEYKTKSIISAINTYDTFFRLLTPDQIDIEYREHIKSVRTTPSAFQIYLGLPFTLTNNGLKTSTTFFDSTIDDRKRHSIGHASLSSESKSQTSFMITCYDSINTGGRTTVTIAELDLMDDWDSLSQDLYKEKKLKMQNAILDKAEAVTGIPLRKEAQLIFSATPRTMKHFGGMSDGAIMGAGLYLDQSFTKRTQIQTPIKNLFLAGAYSSYPGISQSLDSGIITSNTVLNSRIF